MTLHQEINELRRSGMIDEAYSKALSTIQLAPNDQRLLQAFGWVLHDKVKILVSQAKETQPSEQLYTNIRETLREYARLNLPRPDLLFSLLVTKTLQYPQELKFFPKFMKWAGLNSFRSEDFQTKIGNN
ncbi:MAG: hypothetical protein ACKPCM_06065, partial [Pseudanabaena sp.]